MQLLRTIMQAGICSIFLFVSIVQGANLLIETSFSGSELQRRMTACRVEKLMKYVDDHDVAATDYAALQSWCNKQPLVLIEIYRRNYLLFNSNYSEELALSDQNIEVTYYDWYSYYEVPFSDGTAELLIYSDESYVLQTMAKLLGLSLAGCLFLVIVLYEVKKAIRYIYLLTDEIGIMGNGNLEHSISIKGNNELTILAAGLEETRKSLVMHRQNEEMMVRQNRDMITGLSHDLRTPLTKLMLCVEIIQEKKYGEEKEVQHYLKQIYNNSLQLKAISEHILQYALSQREIQNLQIRTMGFQDAFFDILSEMVDYFIGLGFEVECSIEWMSIEVEIIDLSIRRILDNIVSNIEKYADKNCPVSIVSIREDDYAGFEFRNKKSKVNILEGHHIGLENLQAMVTQMGGLYQRVLDEDCFGIRILFHICHNKHS